MGLIAGRKIELLEHLPLPEAPVPNALGSGTFVFRDAGTLELGIVRDSVLRSGHNDFQLFGETFENVARVAPASAYVVSTALDG